MTSHTPKTSLPASVLDEDEFALEDFARDVMIELMHNSGESQAGAGYNNQNTSSMDPSFDNLYLTYVSQVLLEIHNSAAES